MVYIPDFSYNLETTTKLWHFHGGRVTLLDHHKSAMEELQGQLPGCYFDMNRSAAAIAWGYFKPLERMPDLLAYVQDRDLWRWELPDSRAVNAAIEAAPWTSKYGPSSRSRNSGRRASLWSTGTTGGSKSF